MKKIISVLLALILCFTALPLASFAADEDALKFSIATDIQSWSDYILTGRVFKNLIDSDYSHIGSSGIMGFEAGAITDEFFEKMALNDSEFILMPGDFSEFGTVSECTEMALRLSAYEKTVGKPIYVIPGNHEYYNLPQAYRDYEDQEVDLPLMSVETFKALYFDFGYSEAVAIDPNSASYRLNLNDEYALIGFDTASQQYISKSILSEERVNWLKEQIIAAEKEGKKILLMMHHSLIRHSLMDVLKNQTVDADWGLPEFFAQHNVKFVFSGHIHSQDVASYEGSNGKTIYDISTGSLTTYPCPYRNITLTDEEMVIKTEYIEDIDTSKLSTIHIKPEALAHAERDFKDYAKTCLDTGFESQLYFLLCHRGIVQKLGFNEKTEPELYERVINFSSKLYDVMKLPLYEKDAEEGATSLEALAKEYGTYLAKSDYKDLMSLLTEIYNCNSLGDESYYIDSTEIELLTTALAVAINYTIAGYSAEEYALLMNGLAKYISPQLGLIPMTFLEYAGSAIKRFEGCEIYVTYIVSAFVADYTTDKGPSDNNLTLPGYGADTEKEQQQNFMQKLKNFFLGIYHLLIALFEKINVLKK